MAPGLVDLSIGVLVGAVSVVPAVLGSGGNGTHPRDVDVAAVLLVAVLSSAVVFRRRFPLGAFLVGDAAVMSWFVLGYPGRTVVIVPFVLCANLTLLRGRWWGVAAGLLTFVSGSGSLLWIFGARPPLDPLVNVVAVSVAAVAVGEAVRYYRAWQAEMRDRLQRAEQRREEETHRLVAEERLRIARELHDVVAHSIATISVQAGVAAHVMDRRPDQGREALLAIKQTSDEALRELRFVLSALRDNDEGADSPGRRAPAPGMAQLPGLLDMAQAAGLEVSVSVEGDQRSLPDEVDLAAYRVIQESLTNIIRHSGARTTAIRIGYRCGELSLEITDDGGGTRRVPSPPGSRVAHAAGTAQPADPAPREGHGLIGMRERARTLGGRLEAGPLPGRGFRVACDLPIQGLSD
jgi:signal transduction histidine kinase